MPTMLIDEPLVVNCVFSDGSRAEFSLEGLPNHRLARVSAHRAGRPGPPARHGGLSGHGQPLHPGSAADGAGSRRTRVRPHANAFLSCECSSLPPSSSRSTGSGDARPSNELASLVAPDDRERE